MQIFAWGSTYYLPAVIAQPVSADTGWSLEWVVAGLSLGTLAAGLISPYIGAAIDRSGGRDVLAFSACSIAGGLLTLAAAPNLILYVVGWLIIGVGMGAGLYDAAFATLGRLYGQGGRSAITMLTLFGGFASTICWPISALLLSEVGWRGACTAYAGVQLLVALPLYLYFLPRQAPIHLDASSPAADLSGWKGSRVKLALLLATTSSTGFAHLICPVRPSLEPSTGRRDVSGNCCCLWCFGRAGPSSSASHRNGYCALPPSHMDENCIRQLSGAWCLCALRGTADHTGCPHALWRRYWA